MYYLIAVYLEQNKTDMYYSEYDFRRCERIEDGGKKFLISKDKGMIDLTNAYYILIGEGKPEHNV
ncbi:hypothetical protein M3603_08240 [Rummeliibacillus stabekisii]|uniref:Uncharacterized protein n=1 Tax=Rummeliibacillus stabekisii TaxID=241244 RepID=A0A143HCX3_9BACL|nr:MULTISPECIES: hypothetical protein [Rummeliibacillus]AMW99279.1 hypothetical protein ATY39_07260 [Rummeliibacillus stabekisii]MCM3316665.1 hypothetical protein [Rummeliibacillus stabekisii]